MASFADTAFFTDAFSVNAFDFGGASPTGGKGDNEKGKKRIFRPTGLADRPKKPLSRVDERAEDSSQIQAEIAQRLAREFGEDTIRLRPRPVVAMSPEEIDLEIGVLLRKKLRTDEDEIVLLLLMAAAAV